MPAMRPKEFDDRVMEYIPFLRRLAKEKTRTRDDAEDLVQDAIELAFSGWEWYDESESWTGYLKYKILDALKRKYGSYKKQPDIYVGLEESPTGTVQQNQEHVSDLNAIARVPGGVELIMHAAGWDFREIGAMTGVTKQRAHQCAVKARVAIGAA